MELLVLRRMNSMSNSQDQLLVRLLVCIEPDGVASCDSGGRSPLPGILGEAKIRYLVKANTMGILI